jgi:DNA-binding NtrC family response regulator
MSSDKGTKDDKLSKAGLIKTREEFEKRLILNVLEATRWNQSEAAKILKISRNYLIQKAKQFGIGMKKAD